MTQYDSIPSANADDVELVGGRQARKGSYSNRLIIAGVLLVGLPLLMLSLLVGMNGSEVVSLFSAKFEAVYTYTYTKSASQTSSKSLPNIVFILADDLGYTGFGKEALLDLETLAPNLHRLAGEGIILDNYYAQEVCTPSRAAFMTGRYPVNIGLQFGVVEPDVAWALNLNETLLPEILSSYGYKSHMLGKWHLGHQSPRYLPTARGFDSFIGYVDGDNYYFSKRCPTYKRFHDFLIADSDCYYGYPNETDFHKYSTHFYTDKAIEVLDSHDFDESPLFLYMAYQAVHGPFGDFQNHHTGVDLSYVNDSALHYIKSNVVGETRKEYAYTLNILDQKVGDLIDKLDDIGQLENTHVIFASDNGGCYKNGGLNYPYRGTKASLFEGGSKVDAFIYSPGLLAAAKGSIYAHLFHVTDWVPTLFDMIGITYTPHTGYDLNGISHEHDLSGMVEGQSTYEEFNDYGESENAPRQYMVYNGYYNVKDNNPALGYVMNDDTPFAVRNNRYKLIQTKNTTSTAYNMYTDVSIGYDDDPTSDDGDVDAVVDCQQSEALSGDAMGIWLFDLVADPSETTNLYNSTDTDVVKAKELLWAYWEEVAASAADCNIYEGTVSKYAEVAWKDADNWIVPWIGADDDVEDGSRAKEKSYPDYCEISQSSDILTD